MAVTGVLVQVLSLLNTPSVPDSEDRNRIAGSFPRGFMPPSRIRASSWSAQVRSRAVEARKIPGSKVAETGGEPVQAARAYR